MKATGRTLPGGLWRKDQDEPWFESVESVKEAIKEETDIGAACHESLSVRYMVNRQQKEGYI